MRRRWLVSAAVLLGLSSTAIAEDVVWTNAVGVSVSGNSLTKTAAEGWNAGAASKNMLQGGYGYVEFTVPDTTKSTVAGLSYGDSDQNWPDLDFSIHPQAGGALFINEGGIGRGQFGSYAGGDRLRVEVYHGVVRYLRNGSVLYVSSVRPRYPLRVDTSLYHTGATLSNVRVGNLAWTSEVGVSISGSSVTKTGSAGWNAGASSANVEWGDALLEFTAGATNTARICGLSSDDANQGFADVDFGAYLRADGTWEVVEGGVSKGNFGAYDATDTFRIEVVGNSVRYLRAGSLAYTSLSAPVYPLRVDTSFDTPGGSLIDVFLGGLVWTNQTSVVARGTSLEKTGTAGWNSRAASTNEIASGDGYVEWTAIETNTRRLAGLKAGAVSQSYNDINFGLQLSETGTIEVVELGVVKGQFGSYALGDRFRIEIQEGVTRYLRGGTLLYVSTTAPQYPLHAEATLYSTGATITDVAFGDVVWSGAANLQIWGGTLIKGGANNAWDAGAVSTRAINSGFVEFTAGETNVARMIGLSHGNTNEDYADIDHAIYLSWNGELQVYEAGTLRGTFGTYATGDRFRVEIQSGTVKYYEGSTLIYTSGVTPVLPLRVDTALYAPDATILKIRFEGGAVTDQLLPPTFSPPAGTFTSPQDITISAWPGSTIRYTLDGTDPTDLSPLYSVPVAVDQSRTLKAKAWKTGWTPSTVAAAAYELKVAAPALSVPPGTYSSAQTVTVTCSSPGAVLHYTTSGVDPTESDPTIASGGTLAVDVSMTVKVRGWRTGWTASDVTAATYTLKVATPTFSPVAGSYSSAQTVTISTTAPGGTIRYTTSGTEPSETDPSIASGGSVPVSGSSTLKARGYKTGWVASDTGVATYWLNLGTVGTPTLNPAPGTYTSVQTVTATGPSGATLRYTCDGTEPTVASPPYMAALTVGSTTQLKVRAFKADMTPSAVATGLYVIDAGTVDAPRFSPGGGSYAAAQDVAIVSETPGATIRYTTNGLDPVESDPVLLAGQTVRVDQDLMLRARAWKTGMPVSAVTSASYAITGAVAAGSNHSLALKSDGTLWTWGWNNFLQLGDPSVPVNAERLTPAQVPGLIDVVAIAAGANHNLALKRDRTVWAWGYNGTNQLGNGGGSSATPTQVAGLTDVIALAAGEGHSLALKNDGTLWEWGSDGHTWYGSTPVQIAGISGITKIAAGFRHSLALKTDGTGGGTAWAWGTNSWGDLGDGTLSSHAQPAQVPLPADVTAIAGGYTHSLAVRNNDTVWAWGSNGSGGIGDGTNTMRLTPVETSGMSGTFAISAGIGFSLALRTDSSLWAWGDSYYGTLGNGEQNFSYVPLKNVVFAGIAISANGTGTHALGLRADGSIWVWGDNYHGKLGDGTTNLRAFPVPIPGFLLRRTDLTSLDTDGDGLSNVAEVAAGTNPANPDTNGDGITDGTAIAAGKSATNPDMDGDTVSNADERTRGTDPFRTDTDGDGALDGPDCFPLDPTRWQCPASNPNDHTPPTITLQEPTSATLISSQPPP